MVMAADHRPLRYVERADDGTETVVYRASSLGACDRAVVATARGMVGAPKPAWFQEILDEGTICEGEIASLWEEETGIPTVNDQMEVELEIGEIDGRRVIIRGHIDGEAARENVHHVPVLREYKKFRPSTWENFLRQGIEVNKNYPWQVSVYMHALGADECEFVGGHLTGYRSPLDQKIYDSPGESWTRIPVIGEVQCKPITAPPIPLKDIRRRIVKWERLINTGFDATEVPCNKAQYPCPFYVIHDDDGADTFELPDDDNTAEVIATLVAADRRLAELRKEMAEHDRIKKDAVTELREIVGELGPDADAAKKLVYGKHTITRKRYHQPAAERRAYDVDSFSVAREKGK